MTFSTGFWDSLFGKRTTINVTTSDGKVKDIPVTIKWLETMEHEGRVRKVDDTEVLEERIQRSFIAQAELAAVGSYSAFVAQFPSLSEVSVDDWDFYLVVGASFGATLKTQDLNIDEVQRDKLRRSILSALIEWKSDGERAFLDCETLFHKTHQKLTNNNSQYPTTDALGYWIVFNLLKRPPQEQNERDFMRTVGGWSIGVLGSFWE